MTELVIEPFVNEFGQKIEPGEVVLFAGSSYKSTAIRKGIFKGVRYDDVIRTEYVKDENGEYVKEEKTDWRGSKYFQHKTLTKKTREVVAVVIEKVNRGKKWQWVDTPEGKRDYVKTDEDIFSTSTLPLKRVYKYSTPLSDMAGTYF